MSTLKWARYRMLCIICDFLITFNKLVGDSYVRLWSGLNKPWFDHRFDYLRGPKYTYWQQRGILGSTTIREGDLVLDLCCGEGFYDCLYFKDKALAIDAIDRDSRAITIARQRYSAPNIQYFCQDVLTDPFPHESYDTILMFGAIEHFSEAEQRNLLHKIAHSLKANGWFYGSTAYLKMNKVANYEHRREFHSSSELAGFLGIFFGEVILCESIWTEKRTEVYFLCRIPK